MNSAADLLQLLPENLPERFTSADIADGAGIPRWQAQKLVYCLRKTEVVVADGKSGNTICYRLPLPPRKVA